MDKLLEKDAVVRLLALVIAALLWYQAVQQQNPYVEKTIDNVPVRLQNIDPGLTVLGSAEPGTVKVTVAGLQKTVANLTAKDFAAYVDLSGSKPGVQSQPVKLVVPAGTKVVEVNPGSTLVTLDSVTRQRFAVSIMQQGLPAAGYSIGKVFFDPAEVVIEGARGKIAAIRNVAVIMDVNGVTANLVKPGKVNVFDANGAVVGDVAVTPDQVSVSIDVVQAQSQKIVPVKPSLAGDPGTGYQIMEVVLEPDTVTVTGPVDKVNAITSVSTQPIEISGATADVTASVNLQLPEGIAVIGPSVHNVTVKIGTAE